ncbi:MAG: hypothetical protein SGPRY_014129 [Prymnesium sp.]
MSGSRRPTSDEHQMMMRQLDEELSARGWSDGPDLVSLSGVEWDFQNWYYSKTAPWLEDAQAKAGPIA